MVREKDVCWEYCEKLEGNKVRCNFCQKVLNGGISRLKHHLSRVPSKGVHPCSKVRDDVTERVIAILASKEEEKETDSVKKQRLLEDKSTTNSPAGKVVMPISLVTPVAPKLYPSSAGNRPPQPPLDIERCIAEFFFENKLDFSVAHSASYQQMLEALGGRGYRGPSSEALRTTWLQRLKSEICLKTKEIEKEWSTTGCSIIADTWTDHKSRALINFFVSSPSGTFFHKTVDASQYFKTGKYLADLFDSVIQDVGPDNVVQVIVDNPMNYVNVGNHIMHNYNTIFWTPCAAYCLNLIFEDISRVDWVNRCILQAQSITKFIYNNTWVLDLMRKFTGGQEIVRTSIYKSASSFLSLQSILKHKSRLKHMFNGPEYAASPYASKPHSIACMNIIEDGEFWRAVEELAAVCEPLLKVLRDVSGGKPAVGSVYELMIKAMESIRTYYIMDENKYKTFEELIDRIWKSMLHSPLHAAGAFLNPSIQYNPEVKFFGLIKEDFYGVLDKLLPSPELRRDITEQIAAFRKAQGMFGTNLARESRTTAAPGIWWEQYGDSAPGLQRVAVRILNQVCSASIFEKNCSSNQQSHTEKRNKLDKESLNDLLYVHYNLKLQAKGKPVDGDPILLDDIDMTSDWVEEAETSPSTQWLDRFSCALDGDLNTRQFSNSIFSSNDFNL